MRFSPTLSYMTPMLHTLATPFQHSEEIRKSRFLAQAAPAETPQQALAYVQRVSDASATHNCWAYRIGQDYRFNDDGEPGGTAGRPILQAIEGQGIDRAVVVVTRWYGGIKLGAGGLVRAYGGTAAECLRLAERKPIVAMARLGLHCDFADLALMKARLKELGVEIEQESFQAEGVTLRMRLPAARVDEARLRIVDISRGRSEAYELE
ncbi:thymidylate synthase [Dyella nitratireducens]|uniref:Thymidylate synthase n=2 Tax=Dyella nitratireducens TaxID=1849580 RepID=A0ABQ1FKK0_9GAMM|nr:thymidylate synthase [Dyella nitratireducens]GLQ44808.1 thymidylate synthase [Dyella nitratireducens]